MKFNVITKTTVNKNETSSIPLKSQSWNYVEKIGQIWVHIFVLAKSRVVKEVNIYFCKNTMISDLKGSDALISS